MHLKKVLFVSLAGMLGSFGGWARADAPFQVTVDPTAGRRAISPYVYGSNSSIPGVTLPARRSGGNRLTGYNWETNASHAGKDWYHQNDDYLVSTSGIPTSDWNKPGIVATRFHDDTLAAGAYSLLTLQMAGYVAADTNGPVAENEAAPSSRFVAVKPAKGSALSTSPSLTDGQVFMDEFVNFMVQKYGTAAGGRGVKGYALDNEPALWPDTHARIHPAKTTAAEVLAKGLALAKAVKAVDASAEIFGPVAYGFNEYLNMQDATDWPTEQTKGNYRWFIDYYLGEMKKASDAAGRRLLDVLDVHLYSEHYAGDVNVGWTDDYSNVAANKGRLQAPRAWWDSTFVENSWVQQWFSSFLPYLPNLKTAINSHYPRTKLALTEYSFGGEGHITGALAQADALGILGREGVYFATMWRLHDGSYMDPAFALYLNFDGRGGKFGNTSVSASTSSAEAASAYAAIQGSDTSKLHLIVINKNYGDTDQNRTSTVTINIAGSTSYTRARVFAVDPSGATVTERASVTGITGNRFTYPMNALTAAHFVLEAGTVDTTPPTAPTGLTATATSSTAVTLNWTASTDAAGVTGYRVTRNNSAVGTPTGTTFSDTGLTAGTRYTYTVAARDAAGNWSAESSAVVVTTPAAPAEWTSLDIGGPRAGSTTVSGNSFTVVAGGRDIWDSSDQFRFIYQRVDGDGTIVARVTSIQNTNIWAKAGVMIRTNLTPGSPHAYACATAAMGTRLQFRSTANASSTDVNSGGPAFPVWVKLERRGSLVTMSYSSNGTAWTALARTVTLPTGPAYFGVAATSHNTGPLSRSTYEGVQLTRGTPTTPPPPPPPPGPAVPAAPTNVTATAGNGQVSLTWTAVSGATSYTVKRSTTSGTGYANAASGLTATSYTDTGRANGTTYYYVVTATNAAGTSANSAQVSATPRAPLSAPTISSFTASPASLTSGQSATLSWNVSGATSLSISPAPGAVTGTSVSVSPSTSTQYTLTATNGAGSRTATATITVSAPASNLEAAPNVTLKRDDRVATLDMDNDERWWDHSWIVPIDGKGSAGFRVQWWPESQPSQVQTAITPNRRIQLQPLANNTAYKVRVERINALGKISSQPRELSFQGGDPTRVAALRNRMTYLDDFNLPMGPANEKFWNNAFTLSCEPRFHLFFINDQYHVHTLVGTQVEGPGVGDKSQSAQRFRKPISLQAGSRRSIVFDLDGAPVPRGVWYLDLFPVNTDVTGHIEFFDGDGAQGLPAKGIRFRTAGQGVQAFLIDGAGTQHQLGEAFLQDLGLELMPNVRRTWEISLGTDGTEVVIDGKSVIKASFAAGALQPGTYHLLWSVIGYNSPKDNNPYFVAHWDNFGFDGPVADDREVHNYVTRLDGFDYQTAARWDQKSPTFTIPIPDDLRPTVDGATAEAWLVFSYQMINYNAFALNTGDYVSVNGKSYTLPPPQNNASPAFSNPVDGLRASSVRIKLGDLVKGGASPLKVGNNTFQFFAERTDLLNVHVEVLYPKGSAPAYTYPAEIHAFQMHDDLPPIGPPASFESIGGKRVDAWLGDVKDPSFFKPTLSGKAARFVVLAGNALTGNAPQEGMMAHPAATAELYARGTIAGIRTVELFIRPKGSTAEPGERIGLVRTDADAPAPQVRYAFDIDTTRFPNGDYEVFVLATNANGVKSYPDYPGSAQYYTAEKWCGAYYPLNVRIQN